MLEMSLVGCKAISFLNSAMNPTEQRNMDIPGQNFLYFDKNAFLVISQKSECVKVQPVSM
jgi:hypothetical protein